MGHSAEGTGRIHTGLCAWTPILGLTHHRPCPAFPNSLTGTGTRCRPREGFLPCRPCTVPGALGEGPEPRQEPRATCPLVKVQAPRQEAGASWRAVWAATGPKCRMKRYP